ncbi:hypothetical protein [Mesorhizobium sp. L2C084A000]|uniref:hypothetical protein n=1 Tax=unclassified Mesorhizobium TaxID=325217 RepID=UPI0003D00F6C|nr:hypothetical protein [Mesorhizobium sp. L2C084A000]ESZ23494.1 gamma-glutamyl cyclotransferase [Mesorhizobium sp. L2C084A000]
MQKETRKRKKPKTTTESDDCVVHDHPVPPEEIRRYSPVRDADAEQDIANYVAGQAQDEAVKHVERVKKEYVLGEAYEIWDVTTDKNRWWVITNLTNLYSQRYFPSLDYTLSFHIGLMTRLRSREGRPDPDHPNPFDEVLRRQEQAFSRLESAVEAEDLQAVGMQLRECLLALITAVKRRVDLTGVAEQPQAANFKAWSEVLVGLLCPGGSNKELRSYLKAMADDTWTLVNWLTHHTNATEMAASIAVHATDTLVGHFVQVAMRVGAGAISQCPQCSSRNIRSHFDIRIEPDGDYYSTCGSCGWSNHPGGRE